jgi:hypothetical protein
MFSIIEGKRQAGFRTILTIWEDRRGERIGMRDRDRQDGREAGWIFRNRQQSSKKALLK